jgi:small redox-active disulfide protein 2
MVIKILGGGCAKCEKLLANTKEAIEQLGIDPTIEKVTDFSDIVNYGVMKTPALVIDEKVKTVGKVPKSKEIIKLIEECEG